jgi:SAM-dependent methyltransferase
VAKKAKRDGNGHRSLFAVEPVARKRKSTYEPLPSVWFGDDAALLEQMLDFYPKKPPRDILDATVNRGRFWRGSRRRVTGMDINPQYNPDVLADNTAMPCKDESFDVVVYDPPHIPNQGSDASKDFQDRFGLVFKSLIENGYNFTHTFEPFLSEAFRVLRKNGVLFCKIADYVHGHRYQWAHVELVNAASRIGFTPCDCIVKVRKGPIIDPRWKKAHHARRQHCYWLVLRKSKKCE